MFSLYFAFCGEIIGEFKKILSCKTREKSSVKYLKSLTANK